MAESYIEPLLEAFGVQRPTYEAFTQNAADLIQRLIDHNKVDYFAMECRTKDLESFAEKISRPEKAQKYINIESVTDISGIRIIVHVKEDVDLICGIISENFVIDEANSTNKEDLLDPDRFGYLSVHYVVSYNNDRLKLPEFGRFSGMKFEIQIRTILQHTWAAIDWKLRYKSDQEVPKSLKRRLYRISALLEAADEDFSYIGNEINDIRRSYTKAVKKDNFDILIDRESLEIFVHNSKLIRDIEKIAIKSSFSITPPPPNSRNPLLSLLLTIKRFNIFRLSELENILNNPNRSQEILELIYKLWHVQGMPSKLVLDIGGIIRILLLFSAEKNFARDVAVAHPFGPKLQMAVLAALT